MKAFPSEWDSDNLSLGMDLRDYFAAKAMYCLVNDWSDIRYDVAQDCYALADLMMKAREQ